MMFFDLVEEVWYNFVVCYMVNFSYWIGWVVVLFGYMWQVLFMCWFIVYFGMMLCVWCDVQCGDWIGDVVQVGLSLVDVLFVCG